MNLYNRDRKIQHFKTANDIITYYSEGRIQLYKRRREYLLKDLTSKLELVSSKIQFILYFISGKLKISNQRKAEIIKQLEHLQFPKLGHDENFGKYEYLIKMPIYNLTKDKIDELTSHQTNLIQIYNELLDKNELDLWKKDLKEFLTQYRKIYKTKKVKKLLIIQE